MLNNGNKEFKNDKRYFYAEVQFSFSQLNPFSFLLVTLTMIINYFILFF